LQIKRLMLDLCIFVSRFYWHEYRKQSASTDADKHYFKGEESYVQWRTIRDSTYLFSLTQ